MPSASSCISDMMPVRLDTSSMEVGSSATTNDGADDEGARNGDPLALPSRKLMRVSEQKRRRRGESNQSENLGNPVHPVQDIPDSLNRQRFRDGVVDRPPGIHGLVGVLEDQLDVTAEIPHLPSRQSGRIDMSPERCVLGFAGKVEGVTASRRGRAALPATFRRWSCRSPTRPRGPGSHPSQARKRHRPRRGQSRRAFGTGSPATGKSLDSPSTSTSGRSEFSMA